MSFSFLLRYWCRTLFARRYCFMGFWTELWRVNTCISLFISLIVRERVALFPGEATITPRVFSCWPQVVSDLLTVLSSCENVFEPVHLGGFSLIGNSSGMDRAKSSVSHAFVAIQHYVQYMPAENPHILMVSQQPQHVGHIPEKMTSASISTACRR